MALWFQPDSWATILLKDAYCEAGTICRATSCGLAAEAEPVVPSTAPDAPSSTAAEAAKVFLRAATRVVSERIKVST